MKMFSWCCFTFILFHSTLFSNITMGITSSSRYCGEREIAWRIKIAAEKLGWNVFLDETEGAQLAHRDDLDWIICLLPENPHLNPHCPNYITIFHPFNYLDNKRHLLPFYNSYDGYLVTLEERKIIYKNFRKTHKLNFFPFYPSIHNIPYKKIELNDLVTMIPVWGNRLHDQKFKTLYSLLSQTGRVKFYGISPNSDIIEAGYMGSVPFDGTSIIDVLQKHGIVLILHSEIHNREGIPSGRIFEAAAASTVIISDKNHFVKKHFKDSVFYIDTQKTAEDIYHQITAHMNTIQDNPEKAIEMAQKAHEIFEEKFDMCNQLLKLEELHHQYINMTP